MGKIRAESLRFVKAEHRINLNSVCIIVFGKEHCRIYRNVVIMLYIRGTYIIVNMVVGGNKVARHNMNKHPVVTAVS